MKTIKASEILDYYDGIEIFAGRDEIGGYYVGVRSDVQGDYDRYLVVGVRPDRLREFRSGVLDLRKLLLEAPEREWYITLAAMAYGDPMPLVPQEMPLEQSEYLPSPGFFALDSIRIDDRVLQEAQQRNTVMFEFSVEPPEASAEHRIRAATLGTILIHVQTLVKYAYRTALRDVPSSVRHLLSTDDGDLMDVVVPSEAGSFRVLLESGSRRCNAFDNAELSRALERLDEMFAVAHRPQNAHEVLKSYRGHFAGSYIKLINFLASQQTGLQYAWASPVSEKAQHGGISEAAARELSDLLSNKTNLAPTEVILTGKLIRANSATGKWGLLTEKGSRSGECISDGPTLDGMTIGRHYQFVCEEDIEVGVSRNKATLILKTFEELVGES